MKQPELIIEDLGPQDRKVDADKKQLRELADDIHTNGLKHSIVVLDGVVIDGLKRIEAFKLLGRARIPALVTNNFGEAALYLEKVREGAQVGPPRNVEIVEQLEPFRQRYHKLRYSERLWSLNLAKPWGPFTSRTLMAKAIGNSESYTETLLMILKHAPTNEDLARRLALIRRGEDTVHGTYWAFRRQVVAQVHSSAKPEEVKTVMSRGFQTMETTLEAMAKYGAMFSLSREEREDFVQQYQEIRRRIYTATKEIKEGLQTEAKEGKRDG